MYKSMMQKAVEFTIMENSDKEVPEFLWKFETFKTECREKFALTKLILSEFHPLHFCVSYNHFYAKVYHLNVFLLDNYEDDESPEIIKMYWQVKTYENVKLFFMIFN